MKRPLAEGDALTLTPTRLGKRGEAEADHEGWRVRVPGGIPGEAARVTVVHVSRGAPVCVARFEAPAGEAHRARRRPPCPIHESCGGCGLQQVGEDAALALKVEQARELLGVPFEPPITSPRAFEYRCKTFLLPQVRGGRLLLGARPPRGAELVDTSGCNVLRPELEALAARTRAVFCRRTDEQDHLRAILLRCNRSGATQVTLVHRGEAGWLVEGARAIGADAAFVQRHDAPGNRIHSDQQERQVVGNTPIFETFLDGFQAVIAPTAFVQGNPDVAERLYVAAAGELEGERIVELYCGSGAAGLLALKLHGSGRLTGVDRAPRAIAAAKENARRNGLAGRCRFELAAAQEAALLGDAVLVNPPRAGCHPGVLEAVAASPAQKLVYLSCNPATLARDAAVLGWEPVSVTPADMFPQTPHLELLAVFGRP